MFVDTGWPPRRHAVPLVRAGRLRAALALGRPIFWPVSLLPFWCGTVLATRRLLPPIDGTTLVAAIVAGPLVWTAVLAVNDVHDLAGDRGNPRRRSAPLVTGALSLSAVRVIGGGCALAALALAGVVGTPFAFGTAVVLALGWAYSSPPLRLKT